MTGPLATNPQSFHPAASDGPADDPPAEVYWARAARFAAERDRYAQSSDRNANLNLVLVLGALVGVGLGLWRGMAFFYVLAGALFLGFVAAYINLGRLNALRRREDVLRELNDEGPRRLRRDWDRLPLRLPGDRASNNAATSAYAADLDLLGRASLQHLLRPPGTRIGRATLQRWIVEPAPPETVRRRQAAVAELAPLLDYRDELALRGRQMDEEQPEYEEFVRWAEDAPWLAERPWLIWLARGLSVATVALILAELIGLIPYPIWIAGVLANLVLLRLYGKPVEAIIEAVEARQNVFLGYAALFQIAAAQDVRAPELARLRAAFTQDAVSAETQMRRLARIMPLATLRRSQLYFPIQLVTLASFHTLWLLERWQRVAGAYPRKWLAALGELEALAALAALAFDQPAWAFPRFEDGASAGSGAPAARARALGHPLLPPDSCVTNDVTVGPPGSFLLVTGSNMSGKSTLLRALGVNVALAQMGGPVCAAELRLPPLAVATSIRIQDSLEQGVSYFMAELRRLKAIVDEADALRGGESTRAGNAANGVRADTPGRVLLFLLDEILSGTNTAERQIAARRIIRHLVAQGAIGAVSTHDLTLAEAPDLAAIAERVHFSERFTRGPDGPAMSFDYRLRPGLASSTNALTLMEIVGLDLDEASADGGDGSGHAM